MSQSIYTLPTNPIEIVRGRDGFRTMFLISSNPYRDREDEFVMERAINDYVESCWKGRKWAGDNVLLYWHGGDPLGDIVDADVEETFLLEIARERQDRRVNVAREGEPEFIVRIGEMWDMFEGINVPLGASIGFLAKASDKRKGQYPIIKKDETSVLELGYAANLLTYAGVIRSEE